MHTIWSIMRVFPALCHDYIAKGAEGMSAEAMGNLNQLMSQCVGETTDMAASCALVFADI